MNTSNLSIRESASTASIKASINATRSFTDNSFTDSVANTASSIASTATTDASQLSNPLSNPYAAPSDMSLDYLSYNVPYKLASRMSRLIAHYIDLFIVLLISLPIVILYGGLATMFADGIELTLEITAMDVLIAYGVYIVVNGYLLSKYAQTIGKRIMGIYIAKNDSSKKAAFCEILFKRETPIKLIYLIPFAGKLFLFFDSLFIFRSDQRCLHDIIADTQVLKLQKETQKSKPKKQNKQTR